jgi:hypothetical protein
MIALPPLPPPSRASRRRCLTARPLSLSLSLHSPRIHCQLAHTRKLVAKQPSARELHLFARGGVAHQQQQQSQTDPLSARALSQLVPILSPSAGTTVCSCAPARALVPSGQPGQEEGEGERGACARG